MKFLLMMTLALTTGQALACRLTTPIDLDSLLLEKQREQFAEIESTPKLDELMDARQVSTPYPIMLNLSYTMLTERDHDANIIGARISFNDSAWYFGLSDVYMNSPLERSISNTNGSIIHTVSDTHFGKPGMKSVVVIKDKKIVSIEIFNQVTNTKTCVTKALR